MARINTVKGADTLLNTDTVDNVVELVPVADKAQVQVFDELDLPDSVRSGGKAKYPWSTTKVGGGFFIPNGDIKTFYTMCSSQSKKAKDCKYIARKWTGEGGVEGVMVFKRPKD